MITPATDSIQLSEDCYQFKVWKIPSLELSDGYAYDKSGIGAAAWSADGKRLLTGMYDGTLVVWDATVGQIEKTEHPHTGWITGIATEPSGDVFVTASCDRTLGVWNAHSCEMSTRLRGHVREIRAMALAPNGRQMKSWSMDGKAKLWDTRIRRTDGVLTGGGRLVGLTPDGRRLTALTADGAVMFKVDSGERSKIINDAVFLDYWDHSISVIGSSPIAAIGRTNGVAEIWDFGSGRRMYAWNAHEDAIRCVSLSRDISKLATIAEDGRLKIWDLSDRPTLNSMIQLSNSVRVLAFSPDGSQVATGSDPSQKGDAIRVWNLKNGTNSVSIEMWVHAMAFSPDGVLLAGCGNENETIIWDLPSGKPRPPLLGHVQKVTSVAFSPDGATLATGGHDRRIKLWNVATLQEVATLLVDGPVNALQFSEDGMTLAASCFFGSKEVRHRIWRAPSLRHIDEVRRMGQVQR